MTLNSYSGYQTWKRWTGEPFGFCDAPMAAYFRSEMKRSGFGDLTGKRVLELGFGYGGFAGWCRQQGATYHGTEVIPELVSRGLAEGFDVHCSDMPVGTFVAQNSLDLVVAIDVFEHLDISALRELILEVKEGLQVGGVLFARVPSGDSPFSRAIQYGDLTHRTVLGSSAVEQLADEVGLQAMQLREPSFVFRGLGIVALFRRSLIEVVRRVVFFVLTKAFMGGASPVLTPNLVFVLKKNG